MKLRFHVHGVPEHSGPRCAGAIPQRSRAAGTRRTLYVFPLVPETWDLPDQPVDVYSADGEHLFSGLIPIVEWDSARGDHIYGDRLDPQTDDPVAVRYRLIEPFEG